MRYAFLCGILGLMTITTAGQAPGDRPAANLRATRSVVLAQNGLIATSHGGIRSAV